MIAAEPEAVRAVAGARVEARLTAVHAAIAQVLRPSAQQPLLLGDMRKLVEYVTLMTSYGQVEEVRVLFLGARQQLIRDEVMGRGCVTEAPIYVRPILKRALEVGAVSVVVAHNHPSGDPSPSNADVAVTRRLERGLQAIGVELVDHLIVAHGQCFSFRAEGVLQ